MRQPAATWYHIQQAITFVKIIHRGDPDLPRRQGQALLPTVFSYLPIIRLTFERLSSVTQNFFLDQADKLLSALRFAHDGDAIALYRINPWKAALGVPITA